MKRVQLPLIEDKGDIATVERLIAIGYPSIRPVLPHMFTWLQDLNWPVAQRLLDFLSTIGEAAVPEIRRVLSTNDDIWKLSCLILLDRMPINIVEQLLPELEDIARAPSAGERAEEVDVTAERLIARVAEKQDS